MIHFIMNSKERSIIYHGKIFTIEWFENESGKSKARAFYESLSSKDRAKVLSLFERMGDIGKIYDKTKFRHERDEIYAFKPQPHRFLSCFCKGQRIIVLTGFTKKSKKLPAKELKRAQDYFKEFQKKEGEQHE